MCYKEDNQIVYARQNLDVPRLMFKPESELYVVLVYLEMVNFRNAKNQNYLCFCVDFLCVVSYGGAI